MPEDGVVEAVGGMMAFIAIAHAEEHERTGTCLKHEGEVFGPHHRHHARVYAVGADDVPRHVGCHCSLPRMVHGDWIHALVFCFGRSTIGASDAVGDLTDPAFNEIAHLRVERTHGAFQFGGLRNDVEGRASLKHGDRYNG